MRALVCAATFLLTGTLSAPAAPGTDVGRWLADVDAVRLAFPEAIIAARATHVAGGAIAGSADFDVYRKAGGRVLLVFRGGKNGGRKVLTVGEKMWLIVPGARNPVPISANQRLLGGASFGDVARLSFAQDFTPILRGTESVEGRPCHVVELTAKSARAPYPRVTLWLDQAERLPRQALFYLPSGKAVRRVNFTRFLTTLGKRVVGEMEIRELLGRESSAVTRLEYRDYRPAKIDDKIFTPEGARGL